MMNKKHLSLLLTISLILATFTIPVFGDELPENTEIPDGYDQYGYDLSVYPVTEANAQGFIYTLDEAKKEMTITGYNGDAKALTISSNYGGYNVTRISYRLITNGFGGVYEENNEYKYIWNPSSYNKVFLPKELKSCCSFEQSDHLDGDIWNAYRIDLDYNQWFTGDIYYPGSLAEWRNIHNVWIFDNANIHLNSSYEDFINGRNAGKGDDLNAPCNPTTVSLADNIIVNYNETIPYYGKKLLLSYFGKMTVSYDGTEYEVQKAKINKKKKTIQITKLKGAAKDVNKTVKRLTKGKKGLSYTVAPYFLSFKDEIKIKYGKIGPKKAKIKINGKYCTPLAGDIYYAMNATSEYDMVYASCYGRTMFYAKKCNVLGLIYAHESFKIPVFEG